MKKNIGGVIFVQYALHYCKNCKSVEYTDENKCEKCNNDYVLLNDYLKETE